MEAALTAPATPDVDGVLVDDRLVAIGPDGGRHTKEDDLAGYRSGAAVITELVEEQLEVLVAGSTAAHIAVLPPGT